MAKFSDLITVLRSLKNRSVNAGNITGNLLIDTQEVLDALNACVDDYVNTALSITHPDEAVNIGMEIQLEISTPRPGFGLLCENMDALLRYPGARVKEPGNYYLLDSDFGKDDPPPAGSIMTSYRTMLSFVSMLKTCAAFLDERAELLVFVKDGKFEVPVKYTENDLEAANTNILANLSNIISAGVHEKQQISIMAEAVYEMSAKYPSEQRFTVLVNSASELKDRFEKGYTLFAAGFSYEKIRDEIESARVEYSGKIHKIFSDIQNQLLGIPVATIIVATQMKESMKVDGNFWTNLAVLIGSFIFMILMHFLLRNQKHTLEVVGIEINRQKITLEKHHAAIAPNFVETFAALDLRYKAQRRILIAIDFVVFVGFVLAVFFFYKLNMPVQQWLTCSIAVCLR